VGVHVPSLYATLVFLGFLCTVKCAVAGSLVATRV
jgi:hypothetical protein